jgi:hypothetical protein
MATDPRVSLMERRNDNPDLDDMALDIEIEQPGTLLSSADAIPAGIEIEEEEDGGVVIDLDPSSRPDREEGLKTFYDNLGRSSG